RVGHGDCLGVLVVVQGVLAVGEGLVAGGAGLGGLPVVEVDVDDVTAAFEEQGVHGGPDGEVLLLGWVVLLVPVPGGVLHDGADAADPQALHRLVLGLGRAVEDRHARVPSCVVVPPTTMRMAAGWSELARVVLRVGQAAHAAVDADGDELAAEGQPLAARDRDAVAALPDGLVELAGRGVVPGGRELDRGVHGVPPGLRGRDWFPGRTPQRYHTRVGSGNVWMVVVAWVVLVFVVAHTGVSNGEAPHIRPLMWGASLCPGWCELRAGAACVEPGAASDRLHLGAGAGAAFLVAGHPCAVRAVGAGVDHGHPRGHAAQDDGEGRDDEQGQGHVVLLL